MFRLFSVGGSAPNFVEMEKLGIIARGGGVLTVTAMENKKKRFLNDHEILTF